MKLEDAAAHGVGGAPSKSSSGAKLEDAGTHGVGGSPSSSTGTTPLAAAFKATTISGHATGATSSTATPSQTLAPKATTSSSKAALVPSAATNGAPPLAGVAATSSSVSTPRPLAPKATTLSSQKVVPIDQKELWSRFRARITEQFGMPFEQFPPDAQWGTLLPEMPFTTTEQFMLSILISKKRSDGKSPPRHTDMQDTMSQPSTPTSTETSLAESGTIAAAKERRYHNGCCDANEQPHILPQDDGTITLRCEVCKNMTPQKKASQYFSEHCFTKSHQSALHNAKRPTYKKPQGFNADHVVLACHSLHRPDTLASYVPLAEDPTCGKRVHKPCATVITGRTARMLVANAAQHSKACGHKRPRQSKVKTDPGTCQQRIPFAAVDTLPKRPKYEDTATSDGSDDDGLIDLSTGVNARGRAAPQCSQASTAKTKKKSSKTPCGEGTTPRPVRKSTPRAFFGAPSSSAAMSDLGVAGGAGSTPSSRNTSPGNVASDAVGTNDTRKHPRTRGGTAAAAREPVDKYPRHVKYEVCVGVGLDHSKADITIWMALAAGPKRYQWMRQMGNTTKWELLNYCQKFPQEWVSFRRYVPTVTTRNGKTEHVIVDSKEIAEWNVLEQLRKSYKADPTLNHGHVQPNLEDDEDSDFEEPAKRWAARQSAAEEDVSDATP